VRNEVLACLGSLDRHSAGLELQVVYVDNGSRDGSADAVAAAYPETEIVRLARNEGVPARNHGLRRARGRHRMFLDSDATVTPGALHTLVDVLDTHPRVGLVGPRLTYPDGGLQLSTRRYPPLLLPFLRRPPLARFFEDGPTVRRHLMRDDPHDRRRRVEYVLGACQMFRAEAQIAAGEIDRHIWYGHDDADWCFAIRRAGYDVLYVPDAQVVHDYRRSSASRPLSRLAVQFIKAHIYFQLKWRRARGALLADGRAFDLEAESADQVGVVRDEPSCP
jgi:N-acetylglucosaminyl-diphospho-decaprenol L-rhamnosyltransferase